LIVHANNLSLAATPAGSCTGAQGAVSPLGIGYGRSTGAQVPDWCSPRILEAREPDGCSRRIGSVPKIAPFGPSPTGHASFRYAPLRVPRDATSKDGKDVQEPEMSHSRPRESDPATGIAGRTMILARCGTSTRSGALAAASTNRGGNRVGTGSETNKRPVMRRVGVVAPS